MVRAHEHRAGAADAGGGAWRSVWDVCGRRGGQKDLCKAVPPHGMDPVPGDRDRGKLADPICPAGKCAVDHGERSVSRLSGGLYADPGGVLSGLSVRPGAVPPAAGADFRGGGIKAGRLHKRGDSGHETISPAGCGPGVPCGFPAPTLGKSLDRQGLVWGAGVSELQQKSAFVRECDHPDAPAGGQRLV